MFNDEDDNGEAGDETSETTVTQTPKRRPPPARKAPPAPSTVARKAAATEEETETETANRLQHLLELSLSPGVRLAFHTTRPATDADAAALLAAAQPLLAELLRRHLIPITTTTDPHLEDRR